tara:strand:+ start:111 stop:692 length:582 start_codon:yes stop_codon:yes gene_type:complete
MATKIETLDFNQSEGMVNIQDEKNKMPAPMPEISREPVPNTYNDQREKLSKNNIDKEQMMELATPLTEIMDMPAPPTQQQVMPSPQMAMGQQTQEQLINQPFIDAPQQQQGQGEGQVVAKKQNIGNLTDEQLDAVLVGITAAIAFSPQVQEKLVQYIPTLFNEAGVRTVGGTVVTAAVAGGIFLIIKKFVLKN